MNPVMNNPAFALLNAMRNGGNPNALLQSLAQRNPQVNQVMNMVQGKNPQQLRTMAENMAAQRGMNIEQVASQLGINLPK